VEKTADEPARENARPTNLMKTANPESSQSKDAACERCGSFETIEFAGKTLCTDCIQLAGCACAGHGSDER